MDDSCSNYPVNSREWWEEYFASEWEANEGSEQTRHFMERLISELPESEVAYLRSTQARILDWGCAFGEGVDALQKAFPKCQVIGGDRSSAALREAKARFPANEFLLINDEIPDGLDVIVTSNCLEHFPHPLKVIERHLRFCRMFYALLVPLRETLPLHEHHVTRFTQYSFPGEIAGFRRIFAKEIDVDPVRWPGKQILVGYGSREYLIARTSDESAANGTHIRQVSDAAQPEQLGLLAAEVAGKDEELLAIVSAAEKREKSLATALAERERLRLDLSASLIKKEEALRTFEKTVRALDSRLKRASSHLDAKEELLRTVSSRIAEKDSLINKLTYDAAESERTRKIVAAELDEIKRSRGWRFLVGYGRIKHRYLLPALSLFRNNNESSRQGGSREDALPITVESKLESQQAIEINKGYDIICFPIIEWDFRFQRPQQLMMQFARAGHRVFYISQNLRQQGPPFVLTEKAPRVFEVSLAGLPINVYQGSLSGADEQSLFQSLNALRLELSLGATAAFVQLPFWWPLAQRARAAFGWPVIYDCMDHHAGFSTNDQGMVGQELDLIRSADVVVASSTFLMDWAQQHGSNPLLIRNACDYEHFAAVDARAKGQKPVIGYYGAIADWFDSDLVADLAEKRPDWDFILVGSTFTADIRRLSKIPNISLTGEKPYSDLPSLIQTFDVLIVPFRRIPLTEATNPVKVYEILAAGRPVVAVPLPEIVQMAPLIRLAETSQEFEREIAAAIDEDNDEAVASRRQFARRETWEARFEVLAPAVHDLFPRASIIIVTFNNLSLNRLCIENLYAKTEWPNFEVIVVDNGSTDGTPEYLKEAEILYPNMTVLLNESNLGFAAANNAGLAKATGEYLVLLNNDTIPTRGWLSTLIRHLEENHRIGLIGPVTNAIANDAKIAVGYTNASEIEAWAAQYTRENDGRVVPINMLAMFCVAMRRQVFEEVGFLDERFGIGMFEDDDYCRRIRSRGYELRCAHDSFIHHWQRASFILLGEDRYLEIYHENKKKYESKWAGVGALPDPAAPLPESEAQAGDQVDLSEVIARVEAAKGAVIFLPSIGWNITLFQRPHHLAQAFARSGYVSIFDCSNVNEGFSGFKEIQDNLFLFKGWPETLAQIEGAILWTFPYNFDRIDQYPGSARIIYDWIDDLQVFPYDSSFLQANHERALERAAVVASVASRLHEQAVAIRPDALYLPNGVDYSHFAEHESTVDDPALLELLREGKPVAGYYGAFAHWFDYELLAAVAIARTDWNFLLIGQMLDQSLVKSRILGLPNVKWIGPREYKTLPGYLALFDVATIPFAINDITLSTSPLKLYEYLAGGKPVITTPMPECQRFPEVLIAANADEFSRALDAARERGSDVESRASFQQIARENSWDKRVKDVLAALSSAEKEGAGHRVSADKAIVSNGNTSEIESGTEPAREIARRFAGFRNPRNSSFFNALCKHLAGIVSDPCLPMVFEFAITCNERGRNVTKLLGRYSEIRGKNYLDVGCAFGGFLVAFAELGATVSGIDIDRQLLALARHNLADNSIDAPIELRDATRSEELSELRDSFDIITCNDVIEHVDDPRATLFNVSDMLKAGGIAYFEIPNRYHPGHVQKDGHYQLFGITLLDYPEAAEYYANHAPGIPYTVRHYFRLDEYQKMFEAAGLAMTIIEDDLTNHGIETVREIAVGLRAEAMESLKGVPLSVRPKVQQQLAAYLNELESTPCSTDAERREFCLNYGISFWRVLGRKTTTRSESGGAIASHISRIGSSEIQSGAIAVNGKKSVVSAGRAPLTSAENANKFRGMSHHLGRCNICGNEAAFFYESAAMYRESLTCGYCLTTSRYRSIARGILRAIKELSGVAAASIADLERMANTSRLEIYDTQPAFRFEMNAYPIPEMLSKAPWIDLTTSIFRPNEKLGKKLGDKLVNQNLEKLTFPDNTFDIIVTSDVMEHVRLDSNAHREISRVLKPGGFYLFTVPHFRDRYDTFFRVAVIHPSNPSTDIFLTEKEYHGDANSEDGRALSYRSYGTDLDDELTQLGFNVEYTKRDYPGEGIFNTELFFCRLAKK